MQPPAPARGPCARCPLCSGPGRGPAPEPGSWARPQPGDVVGSLHSPRRARAQGRGCSRSPALSGLTGQGEGGPRGASEEYQCVRCGSPRGQKRGKASTWRLGKALCVAGVERGEWKGWNNNNGQRVEQVPSQVLDALCILVPVIIRPTWTWALLLAKRKSVSGSPRRLMSLPETHPQDPGRGDLNQDRFSMLLLSFLPKY